MQLKLLNFHKIVSKFSSYIVEAFIALIIYQATNNFTWALLYMVGFCSLKMLFSVLFFKYVQEKPQLFLLIKIIPFLIYSFSILLLDTNLKILGIFLVLIFESLSASFNELALDCVLNYSCIDKGTSAIGISRAYEFFGIVIAILLGGAFLDHLPRWIVIVIASTSYLISVIPLFVFYLSRKNMSGFNKEPVSNAAENFKNIKIKRRQQKIITRKILVRYFLIYFAFCFFDALLAVFSLFLFKESKESYSLSSYIQVAYYSCLAIGGIIAGFLDEKVDLTKMVSISNVIIGILVCALPFLVHYIVPEIILFALIGFFFSFISIFIFSRMVTRCKILGISNYAILARLQGSRLSQIVVFAFCAINPILFVPSFFLIGGVSISCAFTIPHNEERTRKMLVDFLQNNKMY